VCLSLQVLPVSDISGVTGDDDGTSDDDDDDDVLYFLAEPDGACQVSDDDTVSYDFSDTPNDSDISDRPNGRDNQWTRNKLKCTKTDFDIIQVVPSSSFLPDDGPGEFFGRFFDESVFQWLASQTNLYAAQKSIRYWSDTTVSEMKAFVGILIAMGLHVVPSIDLYWSTDPLFRVRPISQVMPVKRFKKLLQALHVNDNSRTPKRGTASYDKVYKVRPLLNKLNEEFAGQCVSTSSQSIDEAMILFKGRSTLKQYMPMKPTKRGYKAWVRADAATGYMFQCEIYTGKTTDDSSETDLGGRVVTSLTRSLTQCNLQDIHIAFDNFFASFDLMQKLYNDGIYATSTVRPMRKNLPDIAREKLKLQRGEFEWRTRSNTGYVQWKDSKNVHVLSTAFAPQETVTVQRKQKDGSTIAVTCPRSVAQYTQRMGGVDRFDQKRECYTVSRKSRRWWLRIFYFLLDASIVNAYILFMSVHVDSNFNQLRFRTLLFRELVQNYSSRQRRASRDVNFLPPTVHKAVRKPLGVPDVLRLNTVGVHLPEMLASHRRCRFCSSRKNNKRSRYQCKTCLVPLCISPCFAKFHGQ